MALFLHRRLYNSRNFSTTVSLSVPLLFKPKAYFFRDILLSLLCVEIEQWKKARRFKVTLKLLILHTVYLRTKNLLGVFFKRDIFVLTSDS